METSRIYSVSSIRTLIDEFSLPKSSIVWDWHNLVLKKVNILDLRVDHSRIPTRVNLLKRGIGTNPMCILCGQETKTEEHLFLNCRISWDVWNNLNSWWRTLPDSLTSVTDLMLWKNRTSNTTLQLQSAIMLVYIWVICGITGIRSPTKIIKSHNDLANDIQTISHLWINARLKKKSIG